MQKYQSVVQYNTGVAVAGASVTVKNYPSGTTATVYSDNGITPTSNPITTDSTGRFAFYAADGRYSLEITGVSLTPYTVSDVLLEDPADANDVHLGNLTFQPDSKIYVSDNNYGWQDLVSDIYASGPNAPSLQNSFGPFYHYSMGTGAMTEVFANFHIKHDIAIGTDIYQHIHIMTNHTGTGTIRFGFEYSWAHRFDYPGAAVFSTPVTTYKNFVVSSNMAGKHLVVQVDAGQVIPGSLGIDTDALIIVRFFRDIGGGDTFGGDVFALTSDLHYQTSRYATKNRDPDFNA